MGGLRSAFARRRRLLSGGAVGLAALTLAGFALVNPGYPTAEVELHDAGIWVTNGGELLVGRVNRQIEELDAAVGATDDEVDVVQEGATVFAVQSATGTLQRLDVAYVALGDDVRLPAGAQVGLGGGRVTVLDPSTGALWIRDADAVGALDTSTDEADLTVGADGVVAVGPTGVVAAVSIADDELVVVPPDGAPSTVPLGRDLSDAQVTVVGDQPVVLDRERHELLTADGEAHPLDDDGTAQLQQPGPASPGVLVGTDGALLDVPLAGGAPARLAQGSGEPVAPVRLGDCAHGAWRTDPTYARSCGGASAEPVAVPTAEPGAVLRFRVNRGAVVLNDTGSGTVWLLDDAMTIAENWDDVRPPDPTDETDEQSDRFDEAETLDRPEVNTPPVAEDDSYGARQGLPTLQPVLDNDTDADGDVLVITAVQQPDAARGSVQVVEGGRRLQFTAAPGATGTVGYGYTVDDGRGGSASAQVQVEIRPAGVNEPPQLKGDPSETVVELRHAVTHNVLADWIDPDGDEMTLASVTGPPGDTATGTADGFVTYQDSGTAPGLKLVDLVVSDGQAASPGQLRVQVRPGGQLPPTARADHATAFAGEPVVVAPLANDTDPNGDALRLTAVEPEGALEVAPDYVAGTVTLTAAAPGSYYAVYTMADEGSTAQGLIRLDVLPGGSNTPPVAVRDLAFVPAGGRTTVDVLANDVDVDGDVLVLTGITVADGAGVSVSVVDHRFLTIAAPALLPGPVVVTYTVSDGTASAQGGVIVRSAPPNAVNRPPVAAPDTVTVRAGDVATVDVLANDTDPDGDELSIDPELAELPSAGTVTVVGDRLSVQAPAQAGTLHAVYVVRDSTGQPASSQLTVHVRPDDGRNSPPTPRALTARALADSRARVEIPLAGLDPDGDSVRLVGVGSAPTKGRVVEVGTDHLVYEAYDEPGTDTFTYVVEDRFGLTGTATVKVGIAPRPPGNQPPTAQRDDVTTRPGRTLTVDVLVNDSDPDGDSVFFATEPFEGAEDLDVRLSGNRVRIVAPDEGSVTVGYRITDRHGGEALGTLTVSVDGAAPLLPPVAVDDVVPTEVLVPGEWVPVEVLANDRDPDGSAEDLSVSLDVGSDVARTDELGRVLVRATAQPQTIPYTVEDVDGLTSSAVVLVPRAGDLAPRFREGAQRQTVGAGGSTWDLADLVEDPEGADVRLTGSDISATRSDGGRLAIDETTLTFTPAPNYAGPASLTFEVTDGSSSAERPDGNTALLTLLITVDTDVNQPPVFIGASMTAVLGEDASRLDLDDLVDDPDGGDPVFELPDAAQLPAGFDVSLDRGSTLRVAAAPGATPGLIGRLKLSLSDGENPPQDAWVDLRVVSSDRPLTQAVADTATADQGDEITVDVLANDVNPYPGEPLTLTGASLVGQGAEVGTDGNRVTVRPRADFVGTVTVEYSVQDQTGDQSREVRGLLTVAVRGVPERPVAPAVLESRNREVVLSWAAPASNGAPITDYVVQGSGVSQTCPTTTCTITGLRNGDTYTFTVVARNEVGDSPASAPSGPARPDTQPGVPAAPVLTFGDGELTVAWSAPANEGSPITSYDVELSPGSTATVTGTSHTFTGLTNGQSYTARVRAHNSAPNPGEWSPSSAPEIPAGVPDRPAAPVATPAGGELGNQVQVSWTAPATNGAPIDAYTLEMRQGATVVNTRTYPGGTTSDTLPAQNAQDYTFVVTARNKAGLSEPSPASATVRAFGAPSKVQGVSATATGSNGVVRLDFAPAQDNGQAVTEYRVVISPGGATRTVGGPGQQITGLTNGTDYRFTVQACNTYCGPASDQSAAVRPYGPPGAPQVSASAAGPQTIRFSWSPPAENGRRITGYQYNVDGGGWSGTTSATSVDVGTGYNTPRRIQVRAVDEAGSLGADGTASGGPSPASVTVSRGAHQTVAGCDDAQCGYIVIDLHGLRPNQSFRVTYGSDDPGGPSALNARPHTITSDGAGNAHVVGPKVYGYPNNHVWVTVDGLESNHLLWGYR
ncbi:Ig-like domain-containing protein [Blastococcus sp. SYSU D00820]